MPYPAEVKVRLEELSERAMNGDREASILYMQELRKDDLRKAMNRPAESRAQFTAAADEFMKACKEIAPRHGLTAQELWTWILVEERWEID